MDRSAFFNLTNSSHWHNSGRFKGTLGSGLELNPKGIGLRKIKSENLAIMDDTTTLLAKDASISSYSIDINFQGFISHESLGRFLFLASKVKLIRLSFISNTVPNPSEITCLASNPEFRHQYENEENEMASFIRWKLLGVSFADLHVNKENGATSIYLKTESQRFMDSLFFDSIQELQRDINRCMRWYVKTSSNQPLVNSFARVTRISVKRSDKQMNNAISKKGASESIAVKYSKEQTDILTTWMIDHKSHPFPKAEEINHLAKVTNLTYSQVVNWTTNVRKRNLKATVEKGKKPHHFLDFLFLADDRDKNHHTENNDLKDNRSVRKRYSSMKVITDTESFKPSKFPIQRCASVKAKERIKRIKIDDEKFFRDIPNLPSILVPPPLEFIQGGHNEIIKSVNTNALVQRGLPIVTPPRTSITSNALKMLPHDQDAVMDNFLPVDEMFYWSENNASVVEDNTFTEEALVKQFTQHGLVSTPKRRDSLEMFYDLDDKLLTTQLENVFHDIEHGSCEDISLSEDDLNMAFDDHVSEDEFLNLVSIEDIEL